MTAPALRSLARAATVIAVLTVLARVAGFARTAVFGRAVGTGCVGTVYQSVNTIPNIVFDVVAGGMLSALVVPVLAPALIAQRRADVDRIASALLSWTVVVLVPVAALIAVLAHPAARLLLGDRACPGAVDLGARMLAVFSVQVVFYGVGVVLGGLLTAGERFLWPALAPLLSSVTVVCAYLWYGALTDTGQPVAGLSRPAELVLSIGTTLGVAVLALCQLPAVLRMGIAWRPTLRLPAGIGPTVRRAAVAGAATLAAQDVSTAVMIRLANDSHLVGMVVALTLAQTIFLLPWAVLSFPVATAMFPRMSAAWDGGRREEFRERLALAVRLVVALAAGGAALLVAAADPARSVLLSPAAHSAGQLAPAVSAFAVGLLGWSLVAVLARALYAARAFGAAAAAQVTGQVAVVVADVVLSTLLPAGHRAVALALGNSAGVLLAAAALLAVSIRRGLLDAAQTARHVAAAVLAAGVAALVGWLASRPVGLSAQSGVAFGVLAVLVAVATFAGVLTLVDRPVAAELRSRLAGALR